jgi:arsenate reductase
MEKKKVLFLCNHNAARSQMAEGYLRARYGDRFEAFSAGARASRLSSHAVRAMSEIGIDISGHRSKDLTGFFGQEMDLVVTVCDSAAKVCPAFPWAKATLHLDFTDPASFTGTDEEITAGFRMVRDEITRWIDHTFGNPAIEPLRVTIRLGGSLAGTGTTEREVRFSPGATIGTLLESLRIEHPRGEGKPRGASLPRPDALTILLNGRNIEFLQGRDTPLAEGDVLAVFSASEGG